MYLVRSTLAIAAVVLVRLRRVLPRPRRSRSGTSSPARSGPPASPTPKYGILPLLVGTLMVAVIAARHRPADRPDHRHLPERIRQPARPQRRQADPGAAGRHPDGRLRLLRRHHRDAVPGRSSFPGWSNPYNQLSGGIVVGIMILPMVASLSEDALRAVPRSLRDGVLRPGRQQVRDVGRRSSCRRPCRASSPRSSWPSPGPSARPWPSAWPAATRRELHPRPAQGIATMTSFIVRIAKGDVQHGSTDFNSLFAVAGCSSS